MDSNKEIKVIGKICKRIYKMIFRKKETPNCAICRWRSEKRYGYGYACEAQGGVVTFVVNSNKNCLKLYEKSEICLSGKFEIEKFEIEKEDSEQYLSDNLINELK